MQDSGVEIETDTGCSVTLVSEVIAAADNLAARNGRARHPDAEAFGLWSRRDAALINGHATRTRYAILFQWKKYADSPTSMASMIPQISGTKEKG